jgi:phosphoribosyl-ATP pyrophosphohydrolase/phosphoribosyl-AMP cyclohydrolase
MKITVPDLKFDERGLVPAIVQDVRTRRVLMLAYMSPESLRHTLETEETWFWSRSREQLWHKGETSGNTQRVVAVSADCDHDAIVVEVEPRGPACHTGADTCFYNEIQNASLKVENLDSASTNLGQVLENLHALIKSRKREEPEGSYTTYLFNEGLDKILKKLGEEASETIIAAKNSDPDALIKESSDLIYHLLVLLVERNLRLDDIRVELTRRGANKRE